MRYPTDGRSIVTSLVWGILLLCVCGLPAEVHGQQSVPVRDVEDLDGLTRLLWTVQMIFVPDALAHVSPLYAYDPRDLAGRTVHPDRIGDVAIVKTCFMTDGGVLVFSPTEEEAVEQNREFWCANYMDNILEAFNSARFAYAGADDDTPISATPRLSEGTTHPEVYFGTTYPIPGIEPEKRFVAELPR